MSVTIPQAVQMIEKNQSNPNFQIVDVRTNEQRREKFIPNSEHVPLADLPSRLGEFKKETTYLVYCKAGGRSLKACNLMKQKGLNAINMEGGIDAWSTRQTKTCCEIY